MLKTDERQYHINACSGEIGRYCLLPGDPGRCEKIAAYLEGAYHLTTNREYNIFCGYLDGELVTVCSTGIGGPSTAIAVEELTACGADTFIRIGTCGGISLDTKAGDVVIASGAVRQDGTSREYAPIEFPAVASAPVLFALSDAAKELSLPTRVGVVQSKDSFYGQHSPESMPIGEELMKKWYAWIKGGCLASEMESATVFTVAAVRGMKAGCVLRSVWNQERINAGIVDPDDTDELSAARVAIEGLRRFILK